ncbi:hypothetical protein NHX12_033251 [Muraenolepis orangiensis]|uniref:Uncharacterized protein n=1 Tax=Muraenolepis orangiensis TaxID=630683 RepID=A0A9Q0E3J5_9TELE|nr:hypothetical protein NHX12_033251 [Muraenolepis orangiensis]
MQPGVAWSLEWLSHHDGWEERLKHHPLYPGGHEEKGTGKVFELFYEENVAECILLLFKSLCTLLKTRGIKSTSLAGFSVLSLTRFALLNHLAANLRSVAS